MGLNFESSHVREGMLEGHFGLEKESLRVDGNGNMTHTKHPFDNPKIDRDFCENQIELITGVHDTIDDCLAELNDLHCKAVETIYELPTGREYLWPFSSPAYIKNEEDIPIAQYFGEKAEKTLYRNYLSKKYGRKKMTFSGIHFNFSFGENLLREGLRSGDDYNTQELKDGLYLELAKKSVKYSWLLVYLFAASSLMDGSYFDDTKLGEDAPIKYGSPRCSEIGYWNDFNPIFSFDTPGDYVRSIEKYVDCGKLQQAAELYYPIRLKPAGSNSLQHLKEGGIDHIEFRMMDLNPFSPLGILGEDISFLHYFIVYLTSLPRESFDSLEQLTALKNYKQAARYDEKQIMIEERGKDPRNVTKAALDFLTNMEKFYTKANCKDALDMIDYQKDKVLNPNQRYAVRVAKMFGGDYVKKGMQMAKIYADTLMEE